MFGFLCSWMGGILSGGLGDENLCGQEGQEAKKNGGFKYPFPQNLSFSPSDRIRLDKTAARGVRGRPSSIPRGHTACASKPGLLQEVGR